MAETIEIQSLILTIKINSSTNLVLVKDAAQPKIALPSTEYYASLQNISFKKKIYEPGIIIAEVQFTLPAGTQWAIVAKTALDTAFLNKEVTLQYGKATKGTDGKWSVVSQNDVCTGYYVHELHPQYASDSLFVTMIIYSADKQLTLTEKCMSWTKKRLCRDIIDGQASKYKKPYKNENIGYNYSNLTLINTTKAHKEAIFPYLVQYNESYYDFLVRTCNRWGQFLYFEDGKVTIGYNSTKKGKITHKSDDNNYTYDHYHFCNLNEKSTTPVTTDNFADGTTYDTHILNNKLNKNGGDEIRGVIGCDKKHGGDVWGAKIIGDLLSSGKNLYDYTVDTLIDSGIAWGQVNKRVNDNNEQFNKDYLTIKDKATDTDKAHYDSTSDPTEYNEFAEHTPILSSKIYKAVVKGELAAATDAVCIDFNTNYQDLKLGDVISLDADDQEYIVVQVNSKDNKKLVLDDKGKTEDEKIKTKITTVFQVIATKKDADDKNFYPTLHPNGHVRKCEALRGKIAIDSSKDPTKQGRVQVHFDWQPSGENTPWLEYMHPGGKSTGTYHKHYADEEVIVAFADGNMERPYVLGSVSDGKQTAPGSTVANNIVHVTPGGQVIKMTDGTGAGATAFTAALMPSFKMVQGFYPGVVTPGLNTDDTASFEGNIELTDKFGIYSIKGSSDGRNVSIKSPFGDIKLNAFTGITISAPNGDVKIQGKNVTIEAGNNLTLTSGKNIKDGFWLSYQDKDVSNFKNWGMTVGAAVTKKIASMAGGFIDLSMIRNVLEVFMRPIEGKLQVKSNRYLALEAGTGKTAYPVDAFVYEDHRRYGIAHRRANTQKGKQTTHDIMIKNQFAMVLTFTDLIWTDFKAKYEAAKGLKRDLEELITSCTKVLEDGQRELPCKDLSTLINDSWTNPDAECDDTFIGYKNLLAKAENVGELTQDMLNHFIPPFVGDITDLLKTSALISQNWYRDRLRLKLEDLQSKIKELKGFSILPLIPNVDFNPGLIADINDTLLQDTIFKTAVNDDNFKAFTTDFFALAKENELRLIRRKICVKLVTLFDFKRTATGGVAGLGSAAPAVPDGNNITDEATWNAFVNSIQAMPKVDKEQTLFKDFLQNNLGDPFLKNTAILEIINDVNDCDAFGPNDKGKILFSSGQGTMMLENDIMRANVDQAEDSDYAKGTVSGYVSTIREIMNL